VSSVSYARHSTLHSVVYVIHVSRATHVRTVTRVKFVSHARSIVVYLSCEVVYMDECVNCYTCQKCYSCEGVCETCQNCYTPERGTTASQCVNCYSCQVCYTCEGACETCEVGYGGEPVQQPQVQMSVEERLSRLERMVMELYNAVRGQGQAGMNVSPAGCDEYEAVPKERPQRRKQIDLR